MTDSFPLLADPAIVRARVRAGAGRGDQPARGGLAALVDAVESVGSEESQIILRSIIQKRTGLYIPSRAEIEEDKAARSLRMKTMQENDALASVDLAQTAWIDMDPKLKKKYGLEEDFYSNDVGKLLVAINAEKLSLTPLTRGQLGLALSRQFNVPVDDPQKILDTVSATASTKATEAAVKQEKLAYDVSQEGSKRVAEQASRAEGLATNLGTLGEAAQAAAEGNAGGKGAPAASIPIGKALDEIEAGLEQNDWDESEPSRKLLGQADSVFRTIPPDLKPYVARAFLQKHAKFFKDQFENAQTDPATGNVIVGAPARNLFGLHEEATGPAVGNLSVLLSGLGQAMGGGDSEAFRVIGLPEIKGFDPQSFWQFSDQINGKKPAGRQSEAP